MSAWFKWAVGAGWESRDCSHFRRGEQSRGEVAATCSTSLKENIIKPGVMGNWKTASMSETKGREVVHLEMRVIFLV